MITFHQLVEDNQISFLIVSNFKLIVPIFISCGNSCLFFSPKTSMLFFCYCIPGAVYISFHSAFPYPATFASYWQNFHFPL